MFNFALNLKCKIHNKKMADGNDKENLMYASYLDMVAELREKLHENINARFELNKIAPKNDKIRYAPVVDLAGEDITPDSGDDELIASKHNLIGVLYQLDNEIRDFTAKMFFIRKQKASEKDE